LIHLNAIFAKRPFRRRQATHDNPGYGAEDTARRRSSSRRANCDGRIDDVARAGRSMVEQGNSENDEQDTRDLPHGDSIVEEQHRNERDDHVSQCGERIDAGELLSVDRRQPKQHACDECENAADDKRIEQRREQSNRVKQDIGRQPR
jgi:hypothetical protein